MSVTLLQLKMPQNLLICADDARLSNCSGENAPKFVNCADDARFVHLTALIKMPQNSSIVLMMHVYLTVLVKMPANFSIVLMIHVYVTVLMKVSPDWSIVQSHLTLQMNYILMSIFTMFLKTERLLGIANKWCEYLRYHPIQYCLQGSKLTFSTTCPSSK